MICNACPRKCNIDRSTNTGFCSCDEQVFVAKYMIHHWEEPIISGERNAKGSGTIFFSGCNLKCVYCQNYKISNSSCGKVYSIEDLANLFKHLENMGASNINLVTPTHYQKQIIEALKIYKPSVPVIWNSSGYELAEEILKLKDYVDIYLVDLKYMDKDLAFILSKAKDYPEFATKAILQMKQNQPHDIIENGLMKKGLIVRHLVLPNNLENTFKCLDWIKNNLGENQYISIMSQYTPCYKAEKIEMINRKLHSIEYKRVMHYIDAKGFKNGFYQNLDSANTCYIPDF